jgi:hypothetical protein
MHSRRGFFFYRHGHDVAGQRNGRSATTSTTRRAADRGPHSTRLSSMSEGRGTARDERDQPERARRATCSPTRPIRLRNELDDPTLLDERSTWRSGTSVSAPPALAGAGREGVRARLGDRQRRAHRVHDRRERPARAARGPCPRPVRRRPGATRAQGRRGIPRRRTRARGRPPPRRAPPRSRPPRRTSARYFARPLAEERHALRRREPAFAPVLPTDRSRLSGGCGDAPQDRLARRSSRALAPPPLAKGLARNGLQSRVRVQEESSPARRTGRCTTRARR